MNVTADAKKRVVLPMAKPGDAFRVMCEPGRILLVKLESVEPQPAKVRFEKRGRFTVGVVDRPIDEQALREALEEFP
ncbi:MAG TPA: hypothetical protein VJA21_24650 [Verrucomicrobiae bacterium]